MTDLQSTAVSEWKRGWTLVLAGLVGASLPSVAIYALGQFMAPLEAEFGWTRAEISAGVSIQAFVVFALSAFVGRGIDRFSARAIAIPGLSIAALSIASFSLNNGDYRLWMLQWSLLAIGSAMTAPTVWVTAVSGAFEKGRSMAMGMVLCGVGLSSTFAPAVARYLVDTFGWRPAYQLLALVWGGTALLLSVLFFFDRRQPAGGSSESAQSGDTGLHMPGVRGLILSRTFLIIAAAVFAVMLVTSALLLNISPLLVDGGMPRIRAANIAGLAGIGLIAGKLCTGWLFDHYSSARITNGAMILLAAACLLLQLASRHEGIAIISCLLLGLSAGAMTTIIACVTTRYFRLQDFGTVYGCLIATLSFASILGPIVAGITFDRFGSYIPFLWGGVGLAACAAILMAMLTGIPQEQNSSFQPG